MINRVYAPTAAYRGAPSYPITHGLASLWPFRGIIGSGLTLAGFLVIANLIAPQLVEQAIPHWKSQYGVIVCVAVVLGFIRSFLRLFIPVMSLGFWIVALFALTHVGTPKGFSIPFPTRVISQATAVTPSTTSIASTKPIIGSKALPDSAFFPAPPSQGLGSLSKIPGVSSVMKMFR